VLPCGGISAVYGCGGGGGGGGDGLRSHDGERAATC